MARHRTIKPEFWVSEQVVACSPNARLLFIGLWNFCDDYGRHPFAANKIKMLVFPSDFTPAAIEAMLGELVAQNLIRKYVADDKEYLEVTGWHHQKIDKRQAPKFPAPSPNDSRTVVDHSANVPRMVAAEPEPEYEPEYGKKESSLRSSISTIPIVVAPIAGSPALPKLIDPKKEILARKAAEFYTAYPKHVDPKDSLKAFVSAVKSGADPDFIIAAAKRYSDAHAAAGTDKQFIKAPSVWLNKGGYLSEDLPAPAQSYRGPPGHKPFTVQDATQRANAEKILSTAEQQEWRKKHGLAFEGMRP